MSLKLVALVTFLFFVFGAEAHSAHRLFKANKHHSISPNVETLKCHTMGMTEKEDEPGVTTCRADGEESMGIKSLGLACMGVFDQDGTPLKQGCWIHQLDDVISKTCGSDSCTAESEYGPYFCCCTSPMCNKNVLPMPEADSF